MHKEKYRTLQVHVKVFVWLKYVYKYKYRSSTAPVLVTDNRIVLYEKTHVQVPCTKKRRESSLKRENLKNDSLFSNERLFFERRLSSFKKEDPFLEKQDLFEIVVHVTGASTINFGFYLESTDIFLATPCPLK